MKIYSFTSSAVIYTSVSLNGPTRTLARTGVKLYLYYLVGHV